MKKIKKVIHEYTSLDASLFRYSLSYCFLLALLPTLIIVVFLIQNSAYTIDELLVFLYQYLPEELLSPFVRFILNRNYPSFLSLLISLILSCYLASKSFYSFMLISATHEKINTYKLLIRIRSFVMFVVFISGIFFSH